MKNKKILLLNLIFIIQTTICLHEQIFIATVPKTGTHLLSKIITLLTGKIGVGNPVQAPNTSWLYITPERLNTIKPNQFLISHALPIESNISLLEQYDYKGIFLYRDPRDQVVSLAYELIKYKMDAMHQLPLAKVITKAIDGYQVVKSPYYHDINLKSLNTVKQHYDIYLPWKDHRSMYVTTFEKLVGPLGGGTEEEQLQEIKNIAHHIGLNISDIEAKECAHQLFGGTATFRAGKIGSYKTHFTSEQVNLFKKITGELLIQLEYEQNFDW